VFTNPLPVQTPLRYSHRLLDEPAAAVRLLVPNSAGHDLSAALSVLCSRAQRKGAGTVPADAEINTPLDLW
jgi:hypothetical protein